MMKTVHVLSIMLIVVVTLFLPLSGTLVANAASTCGTSGPSSGAYSVTVCFTSPSSGSILTGNTTVTVTVTVAGGTSPGVQRVVFNMDGGYLLTDYQSAYTFTLPTTR